MEETAYFIGALVVAVVCGGICKAIAKGRGMEGGFWWGFLLGIIGIIIVAVRPNDKAKPAPQAAISPYEELEKLSKLKEQGVLSEDEFNRMKAECLAKAR